MLKSSVMTKVRFNYHIDLFRFPHFSVGPYNFIYRHTLYNIYMFI